LYYFFQYFYYPLAKLIEGRSDNFKHNFFITHFFNPPRHMPLLELITSKYTSDNVVEQITKFIDVHLGKMVIRSNDTPGFIANRIGCYWLEVALKYAIEMGISVEEADGVLGKPVGIPKTGVFGLYDLIGLDVMKLIGNSLSSSLKTSDDFIRVAKRHQIVEKMISDGYIGRKGKGGFYRLIEDGNKKIKEAIDLKTGEYHQAKEVISPINGVADIIENNQYALVVLLHTLSYAASLIPEVSDSLYDIDQAMKLGYNWKFGPFELIDLIGPDHFKAKLKQQNIAIPEILIKLKEKQKLYQNNSYFDSKEYVPIPRPEGVIFISDFNKLVAQNSSGNIRDMGDKIAALEITTKMAALDHEVFKLILEFFELHAKDFKGLVLVGGNVNFSVGGNLQFMLDMAKQQNWQAVEEYLKLGAEAMLALKYADIPVVAALKGMALGGGAELLLHLAKVVAHVETNSGLVESGVGLIPAWGGCKELILRAKTKDDLINAFKNILVGKMSSSAPELQQMLKFAQFSVSMNVNRVLGDAKAACLEFKESSSSRDLILVNWDEVIAAMDLSGHDVIVAKELASVFARSDASEDELMQQERSVFIRLLQSKATQERIVYMLETGKRLKN